MYLKWKAQEKDWRIHGDPALCHAQASWESTLKVLKEDGEGYYLAAMQNPTSDSGD